MRYQKLDGIRGLTLVSMILYHSCWDLCFIFNQNMPFMRGHRAFLWQQSICWTFIFLSGFCLGLGHKTMKRGALVFGAGVLVTGATLAFTPESRILFGVLTLLGSSMLIMGFLEKRLKKIPPFLGLLVSLLLFALTWRINSGYLSFGRRRLLTVPDFFYRNLFTTFLGFPKPGFFSTDYFSLMPWFFLFAAGFFLYQMLAAHKGLSFLKKGFLSPAEWLGERSLLIYLIHQPVIYGGLTLYFRYIRHFI